MESLHIFVLCVGQYLACITYLGQFAIIEQRFKLFFVYLCMLLIVLYLRICELSLVLFISHKILLEYIIFKGS